MTNDPITPARLRDLADNAFDTEFGVLQAALRAAADQLVAERETNGVTALLLQQTRAAIAADIVGDLTGNGFQIIDTRTHVAIPREPDEAMVERVGQAIFLCGPDITYREQARVAIAAMTQGGDDGKDV